MKSQGFTHYQREDGIFVVNFSDMRRDTILEWTQVYRANCAYGVNNHCHVLNLYIVKSLAIGPFALQVAINEAKNTPLPLFQSMAIFVSDPLVSMLITTAFNSFTARAKGRTKIFKREEDAINWLYQRGRDVLQQDGVAICSSCAT